MLTLSTDEPSIVVDSVTIGYHKDRPILDGVSLRFDSPGLYRIAGSNGTGKSTLLELISGFLKPWSGTARINGVDASSPEARHLRNVCRTAPSLYPSMTVHDHLSFAARVRGSDKTVLLSRLDVYGLAHWLHQPAGDLSTGNLRKLWILMCTAAEMPIVIIDEPFNGLDQDGIDALTDELILWQASKIVIVISHSTPARLEFDRSIVFTSR